MAEVCVTKNVRSVQPGCNAGQTKFGITQRPFWYGLGDRERTLDAARANDGNADKTGFRCGCANDRLSYLSITFAIASGTSDSTQIGHLQILLRSYQCASLLLQTARRHAGLCPPHGNPAVEHRRQKQGEDGGEAKPADDDPTDRDTRFGTGTR